MNPIPTPITGLGLSTGVVWRGPSKSDRRGALGRYWKSLYSRVRVGIQALWLPNEARRSTALLSAVMARC